MKLKLLNNFMTYLFLIILYFKICVFIRLFNTHEELKKNWNLYKQKQTLTNKSKFRLEMYY